MSNVKNFGLTGVGQEVQLGKGGAKLASEADKIAAKNEAGTLTQVQAADPVADQDVVTKVHLDGKTGMSFTLGTATDESVSDGAVALTGGTSITNAVDALNEILGKLVPAAPTNFPAGQSLTLSSSTSALLASGAVPDNTNGGTLPTTAGNTVTRTTSSSVATGVIGAGDNVGPGDSGTVQALVNGTIVDSQVMSTGANNKASGVLRISNDQAYPVATPGFWETFRTSISGATATQGWNRLKINHTGASATPDLYFVYDTLTANPVVSSGTVTESAAGTVAYSSGIPHYDQGGVLSVSFTASNLAGETYKSGTLLSVSASNSILTTVNYTTGEAGLPAILPRQMPAHNASNLLVSINGSNVHHSGQITATASNVNGNGSLPFGPTILVKRGTTTRVDEMNVPVSIAVNGGPGAAVAARTTMGNGDNPADNVAALTAGNWVSSSAANAWEAAVVGGVLKHDIVNYTSGFLPVGPDRSGFNASQYVTFMIRRTAVSKFDIVVNGSFAGLWVKLPTLSDLYTASSNGWYSMSTLYGGSGKPGDTNGANGSLGCALGAVATGTGSWTATFGTLSSTDSANNIILVRFKLTAGQTINSLSFAPATR